MTSPLADGPAALPTPPNRLLGREQDVAAISRLLCTDGTRLVTLTGPGGVGKTHLSLDVARSVAPYFPGGVAFIPLATVDDPERVVPTMALALGLREVPGLTHAELLREALAGAEILLLMDNLEQVLAVAPEIAALLAQVPRLSILATSRAPLRLRSEREYPVEPLALPTANPSTTDLANNPAVALFAERAGAARPAFNLTTGNIAAVAEIARQLDGLPLAIELAAAMIRVMPPQAILDRLDNRLRLLVDGAVDLPPRQRTLRGAIAWSYDLLAPDEQRLFRLLAVFAGGASLDAIEAVAPDPGGALVDSLTALVSHSLLIHRDDSDGDAASDPPRYRMLATIRDYALERLEESGEAEATRQRHLDWLVALAERADAQLTGPEQLGWLRRLDAERDNIGIALDWALGHDRERGLRLASLLWRYWSTHGLLLEGHAWVHRFLDAPEPGEPRVRAQAYSSLGNLALDLGDYDAAAEAYGHALRGWEALGDQRGVAGALNGQGLVDWYRGDYASARRRHEQSLALRREVGDRHGESNSLSNLGNAIKDAGDPVAARIYHEQALALRRELGHRIGIGYSLLNLGDVARRLGDAGEARARFEQSLDVFERAGDTLGVGYARQGLGMAAMLGGNTAEAGPSFAAALGIRMRLGDRRGVAESIEGLASIAAQGWDPAMATTLFAAAGALRKQIGAPVPEPDRRIYDRSIAALRRSLPAETFAARWADGERLSIAEAVARAIRVAEVPPGPDSPLSDREIDVLRLVAAGLTNGQVAERLYLSRRTVDAHMRRIYDKLDLTSRGDVIRYAVEHGLT